MAAPRVLLIAVIRTVFLAIVLGTAAVALAQPSNVEELGKPLTGWGVDLGNIEKSLENDYLADEALVRLREESEAVRNEADALVEQIRQKLTATQTQLDNGAGLHIVVTPRYSIDAPVVPPAFPPSAVPFPSECWVDDDRRLHCRIRWQSTSTADMLVLPGVADYQVIVTIGGA